MMFAPPNTKRIAPASVCHVLVAKHDFLRCTNRSVGYHGPSRCWKNKGSWAAHRIFTWFWHLAMEMSFLGRMSSITSSINGYCSMSAADAPHDRTLDLRPAANCTLVELLEHFFLLSRRRRCGAVSRRFGCCLCGAALCFKTCSGDERMLQRQRWDANAIASCTRLHK